MQHVSVARDLLKVASMHENGNSPGANKQTLDHLLSEKYTSNPVHLLKWLVEALGCRSSQLRAATAILCQYLESGRWHKFFFFFLLLFLKWNKQNRQNMNEWMIEWGSFSWLNRLQTDISWVGCVELQCIVKTVMPHMFCLVPTRYNSRPPQGSHSSLWEPEVSSSFITAYWSF